MVNRRVLATALAVVACLCVAACGDDDDDSAAAGGSQNSASTGGDDSPVKLGVITKFPVDFFFEIENAAKEWDKSQPGYEVVFGRGKAATDDEGVIQQIESMVSQGVKGIAITPTSDAVVPALEKAIDKGVKVVLLDNDLPAWDGKSSVVATNNLKGGELAGQWLAGKLKPGDTVAVLEGVPGVPALDDRVKGMESGLGDGIKVIGKAPTDCAQDKGVAAAEDLLTRSPDVTAIYSACGPPAVGAIEALKNAKRKPDDVILMGFDASPDEVKAIMAGTEDASVAQFPSKIGAMGIETLANAVEGKPVEQFVDTGTEVVTSENASEFSK
jgi:ABC-type sugar transport system substrate-binding protein